MRYMHFRNPQGRSALGELRLLQPQALGFLSHIDPLNSAVYKGESKTKQHKFIHCVIKQNLL